MVFFEAQEGWSGGHHQPFFIPIFINADKFVKALSGHSYQLLHLASQACLIASALGVAIGVAAPAQANVGLVQYKQAQQHEQSLQTRNEKLRRLQAGISPERRIQRQLLNTFSQQHEEAQLEPAVSSEHSIPAIINSPADGIYLYGQQPTPNQLATAYFVFESQGGRVTGAFYMPSSSFDCVQGHIGSDRIALNVTDSYSQETASYSLGLHPPNAQVAGLGSSIAAPPNISGFHQLPVSDRDRALLSTCQASN